MKLKRNVVMLPTKEKSKLFIGKISGQLCDLTVADRDETTDNQELYITSDEKPVDGDWVIPNNPEYGNRIWKYTPAPCPMPYWGCADNCKKIIVTTNKSLGLPSPSDGFVKKFINRYNAGNPITEVMVEYEGKSGIILSYGRGIIPPDIHLKVDKNNCITITSVKDTWTREEVISLCRDCFENSCKYSTFNEWIEQNL